MKKLNNLSALTSTINFDTLTNEINFDTLTNEISSHALNGVIPSTGYTPSTQLLNDIAKALSYHSAIENITSAVWVPDWELGDLLDYARGIASEIIDDLIYDNPELAFDYQPDERGHYAYDYIRDEFELVVDVMTCALDVDMRFEYDDYSEDAKFFGWLMNQPAGETSRTRKFAEVFGK